MIDHAILMKEMNAIAKQAGDVIMPYFKIGTDIIEKGDGSPVTKADQEAEEFIISKLADIVPDIPVIGEESVAAGHIPDISSGTFFLVDPLDGTKAFINGEDNFTVNIALMQNFKPVIGAIYVPVKKLSYWGIDGKAFREDEAGNIKEIHMRDVPAAGLTIITSKHHTSPDEITDFLNERKINDYVKCTSSIKFCILAEGGADMYPRFGPTCEWDTAAGEAIINAAGGHVTTMENTPFIYGKADIKFLNPGFIVQKRT